MADCYICGEELGFFIKPVHNVVDLVASKMVTLSNIGVNSIVPVASDITNDP